MQLATALVLLVTCELCLTIRVPPSWDDSASEVKQEIKNDNDEQFSVESFRTTTNEKHIPTEYFEYTAKKPQFAVDVATFHGVQSPENHYRAYPIKPHTGETRPELGKHRLLDKDNSLYRPLQEYANINEDSVSHVAPVSSNYEVFHPYDAESPALQEIYKDPVLNKIRSDLENSKNRLHTYEKDGGNSEVNSDEYLESPQKTDSRFGPRKNIPAPYEIHRPQRRPIYYMPIPKPPHREQYLNQRLRHPWNQYSAKIRPVHYKPIKNHINQLRQNHAFKYDDERNEYPQVHILENYSDPKDGYDIYERGKDKFVQLRNNVDESINKAVKENRPSNYEKLEVQNNDYPSHDEEDEFVPIKNYAQVRKTETFKHMPRSAALADAETFDEIRNAPRLRQAIKSTKAQTVYSEEGYEDSAYDHAGEQKHASENEGHGGFLKQHELSGGKYKTPSESAKYQDGGGSAFRDEVIHAEKWKNDDEDKNDEINEEDYSEDENEKSVEIDKYQDSSPEDGNLRNKRENDIKNKTSTEKNLDDKTSKFNDITLDSSDSKQHNNFKIPDIDLKSTFLTGKDILKLSKLKIQPMKNDLSQKYPYYHNKTSAISSDSPLRYAENLMFIPKKSSGGTEFYDSRSKYECPEVDDTPDPIPEKLNGEGHPDDNGEDEDDNSSTKGDENFDTANKTPRLKGLGDKIDCFKAKYFGENPLDSPFFKEDKIENPRPITPPNKLGLHVFNTKLDPTEPLVQESKLFIHEKKGVTDYSDIFDVIEKLRNDKSFTLSPNQNISKEIIDSKSGIEESNNTFPQYLQQQYQVYNDVMDNIKNTNESRTNSTSTQNLPNSLFKHPSNNTYFSNQNKEDVTKEPRRLRRKRSTPFVYEPYKIIRDSQVQDSKKTTTSNNISPLIRKLQSSRVIDRVAFPNQDIDQSERYVKRNINTRMYKDIGKKDREIYGSKNDKDSLDTAIIDVSIDKRRGEPRYEIKRPINHKPVYMPVSNKKTMSIEEYRAQVDSGSRSKGESSRQLRQRSPMVRSISNSDHGIQNIAESSNTVRRTISTTTTPRPIRESTQEPNDDDYEEYDDDHINDDANDEESRESTSNNEKEEKITNITGSVTPSPSFKQRVQVIVTTEQVPINDEQSKLKLVTRFRDYKPDQRNSGSPIEYQSHPIKKQHATSHVVNERENTKNVPEIAPKYREKKKKSSKSTLVTDTKRYGDDDNDMQREEVDALIGVKQNMDDYMPLYEKENEFKNKLRSIGGTDPDEDKNDDNDEDTEDDHDDDDDEDDSDDEHDENEEEDEADTEEVEEDENNKTQLPVTTPEPTKRTLAMTTVAPAPTTATRNAQLEAKPVVTRKRIEIHKELPANNSSPHITQYKQDIKEIEIVKEIPTSLKRKPQKNLEALELYKDDNLAKDINKLGGVEIFKENIDLKNGPKHGGNYRRLEEPNRESVKDKNIKDDAVASQSEFTKHVEFEENTRNKMHGGNLKALSDMQKTRSRSRSEKIIELSDAPSTAMHGGNLKSRNRGRGNGKSQKLIEFDDDDDDNDDEYSSSNSRESSSRNSRPMHGGNYRSAKIVATEKPEEDHNRNRGVRRNAAAILNSFVQAVPILTTTPAYILDPSKRMYYYVDA